MAVIDAKKTASDLLGVPEASRELRKAEALRKDFTQTSSKLQRTTILEEVSD